MARPLAYDPVPPPTDTARDELEQLLQTLHESGTLRLLDGLLGRFPDVTEVAVGQLNTGGGRNLVGNVMILLKALTELDSDGHQALVSGIGEGLQAAHQSLQGEPPGLLGLLRRLGDEDVRRGLNALLVFVQTLGRHLHQHPPPQSLQQVS